MDDAGGSDGRAIAERVRRRLVAELERAYEEAGMQGLCGEGALEYALDRVRTLDPAELAADPGPTVDEEEGS